MTNWIDIRDKQPEYNSQVLCWVQTMYGGYAEIADAPQAAIGTGLNINIDTKDKGKASNMIGNRVRIVSMDSEGTV